MIYQCYFHYFHETTMVPVNHGYPMKLPFIPLLVVFHYKYHIKSL